MGVPPGGRRDEADRGVIDAVLSDARACEVVATEVHGQLQRVEQQLRWAGQKADSLPVRVSFTQFSAQGDKHTLTGTITNKTAKPKNFSLKIEFLDKTGNVVASQDALISLPPSGTKDFTVEVQNPNVVAFRYPAIS